MEERKKKIEKALIEWRENQKGEYRNDYLFNCGELGIARLYYTYSGVAGGIWVVFWPLVDPCPVMENDT